MARQDSHSMSQTSLAAHAGPRSGSGAGLLVLCLGLALAGFGIALAAGPQHSPQIAKVAEAVNGYGIQHGLLIVGGLCLFAIGLVGRGLASSPRTEEVEDDGPSEFQLFSEQLNAKLAQLRTSLLQVSEEVTALAASQQAHFHRQAADSEAPDHGQDAIFRLAASLDKLNAHVDERIHGLDLQLRSGLESVANIVTDARRLIERKLDVSPSSQGSAPHAAVPHARTAFEPDFPARAEQSHAPSIDFFETLDKLDAIAKGGASNKPGAQPRGRPPQSPYSSAQGDALDALLPDPHQRDPRFGG